MQCAIILKTIFEQYFAQLFMFVIKNAPSTMRKYSCVLCTCTGRCLCRSWCPLRWFRVWSSYTSHSPPEDDSRTSAAHRSHSLAAGSAEDKYTHPWPAHTDVIHSYTLERKNITNPLNRAFIHLNVYPFTHSPVHPLIRSFTFSFVNPYMRPSTHYSIQWLINAFIHSSTHPSIQPLINPLIL